MRQVVDLQKDKSFGALGVELLSISPDPLSAWRQEAAQLGITVPMLSDTDNRVANEYGVMQWAMPTDEPGHTFVLVDRAGNVVWIRDYGAMGHGGLMYVPPTELISLIEKSV